MTDHPEGLHMGTEAQNAMVATVPSPERAVRDLEFYAKRLCVDKPERYEVYQTAIDGTEIRLSQAILVMLSQLTEQGETIRALRERETPELEAYRSACWEFEPDAEDCGGLERVEWLRILLLEVNEWIAKGIVRLEDQTDPSAFLECLRECDWLRQQLGVAISERRAVLALARALSSPTP